MILLMCININDINDIIINMCVCIIISNNNNVIMV